MDTNPMSSPGDGARTKPEGVGLILLASEWSVDLLPKPEGVTPDRLGRMFHRSTGDGGAQVLLKSDFKEPRLLLLFVDSDDGVAQSWLRWTFDRLASRELQGGAARDAMDRRFKGAKACILYFPGASDLDHGLSREAEILFEPVLDKTTEARRFSYWVNAVDITQCRERTGRDIDDWIRSIDTNQNPHRALVDFAKSADTAGKPHFSRLRTQGYVTLKHPESKFLAELPSLYTEALDDLQRVDGREGQPSFFERFLLGFEDASHPIQSTLSNLDLLLRPYSVAPDLLGNLATWVALPLEQDLDEMVRRRLVAKAVELCRDQGTRSGLIKYLRVLTGVTADIEDQPIEGMRLGAHAKLGSDQTVLGDVAPHTFIVTLAIAGPSERLVEILHRAIDFYKPAHTTYKLRFVS